MKATVAELLQAARAELDAPWESELLLAATLGVERTALYCHPQLTVSNGNAKLFRKQLEKRRGGWPVAYLLGCREFWSLPLKVSVDTLIPRPETETLVEVALRLLPAKGQATVADIGTGCGAVALAIASERTEATVTATDIDQAALDVAASNRDRLGLDTVRFAQGDMLGPLGGTRADLIVSNPPYLCDRDPHLGQGDLRFEPQHALSAGGDPLAMLRALVADAPRHLKKGGWLAVEHGYEQGAAVRELYAASGYANTTTDRDLAGHERVTAGQARE